MLSPFPGLALGLGWLIAALLQSQGKLDANDAENVTQIIKAGAESGVDTMTIKMDRENALGIDLALGKLKAARPFRFTAGMRGETGYEIHVTYQKPDAGSVSIPAPLGPRGRIPE